jgi:hypothetical protein
MASNPKPKQTFRDCYGKCSTVKTNANRSVSPDFFNMQRRMRRISLEQSIPESVLAIDGNTARNHGMRNASDLLCPSCFKICKGPLCEAVKFAGGGIFFNFFVPLSGGAVFKPFPEGCKLTRSKFLDFPF